MEPDEYQEQEDTMNVNTQTWRDGSSGGFSNPMGEGESEQVNKSNMGLGSFSTPIKEKKPKFSIEDYEKQLTLWSTPEFKAGYQDLLDEIKREEKEGIKETSSMEGQSGSLTGKIREMKENEESSKELEKEQEEDLLPSSKELSERFGGSFAPILERFKEQIRFEIEDGTRAPHIPMSLKTLATQMEYIFTSAADSTKLKLKDTEPILNKQVSLEMCRVDMKIIDPNAADPFSDEAGGVDTYWVVKEESCRALDEDGIVANPGIGDSWIEMQFYDELNDRTLDVYFKVYLQMPKK